MNLVQLLDQLGYTQSQNYRSTNESSQEPLTEHLFRAAKKAGVQGAYVFQTSPPEQKILPPRPAVYVAEAQTREEAREIHQRLWNLGNTPFLVILLPNEIRVYTGFDFSLENEKKGLVCEIQDIAKLTFENIREKLIDFGSNSIDSGKIWQTQSKHITPENRVDIHLLNNLEKLEEYLEGRGVELSIIHALIGKYVYIRYLYDRQILSREWLAENNINLDTILGRNATLEGLLKLTELLETRFNGEIFPLPSNVEEILGNDETVALVASAFKGDDLASGQLHLDFNAYDFSYIPVETLSSIYEQFLHSQGTGKKVGAVYTPEPVADYLLCELQESKPLQKGMKILDPCCGSGIFLVLAYRRLIELELANSVSKKLKPTELRRILCDSLYGVERNREACYVAEFSLILTLLNYIDPPDLHRNKQFKFPSLHNTQIFECDFFDDESIFWEQGKKFDWIVGNPPWIELKPQKDIKENIEKKALSWIKNNSKNRPVGGNRVCEAFSWRVVNLLNYEGCVGLLVHATSLFNQESKRYRQAFFERHVIVRITNFSNLAYVLFGGRGQEPAATLIYCQAETEVEKPQITHYAPLIVNQITNRSWKKGKNLPVWTITLNEDEMSIISHEDATTGEIFVWKMALWGSSRDKKGLKRLLRLLPSTLGQLANKKKWRFFTGLQLRNQGSVDQIEPLPQLSGWKKIDIHKKFDIHTKTRSSFRFAIPEASLQLINEDSFFVRKGRSIPFTVASAPHIVLNSGYCAYSDIDFIIPEPQIGIAGDKTDADYLRAISILINSSIIQYFLFFHSSSWGVGRSKIFPRDLKEIPLPELSSQQVIELAKLQKRLSYLEEFTTTSDILLQQLLDDEIEFLLSIPSNLGIIAREFLAIKLQFNKGKSIVPASLSPSEDQLQRYGLHLRNELDTFTEGGGLKHSITLTQSKTLITCSVEFVQSNYAIDVHVEKTQGDSSSLLAYIQEETKQRFSQWVYVQRSLRIFEDSRVYICKSPRLIDWTRTQALSDADDIIAEILSVRSRLHEVTK
ncbi:N-6 DNA methylase [Pseudanabaena biceps]|nr:N-6 DNA methylase [Pseudanabaena biceps]